jgi:hypothetical protein
MIKDDKLRYTELAGAAVDLQAGIQDVRFERRSGRRLPLRKFSVVSHTPARKMLGLCVD